MEGKVRKLFPRANTANGSFNFFDNIIQGDINRIFCFKGGPGVGKSSLMRKIAKEFIDNGYDVELHHCPSDPSSLDAILIKELKVVLLDATSPHVVDPKDPGAVDEIINLGDFWNTDNLEKQKEEIIEIGKDISTSFRRAYKFLKAAEPIYLDIEEKYNNAMNFGGINLFTDKFIDDLFKDTLNCTNYKKERHLFGTAITPVGHIDYTDSILSQVKKIYYLEGEIGTGKTTFLRKVYEKAVQKGMAVEVYHYPLIKEKLETIIIKDLDVAITVSRIFEDKEKIDFNQFINKEKIAKYEEEIKFDKKVFNELIAYGIENLKIAKAKHDIIEAFYVPNMRFDEVEKLKDELINRILKYANK